MGVISHPVGGQYDVVKSVQGYVRYLRGEAGERLEARVRRETAQAERAELDVSRARGDLIDHARRWVSTRAAEMRTAWERWPERVAALIASELLVDPERAYEVLESHVRAFLTEIAEHEGERP